MKEIILEERNQQAFDYGAGRTMLEQGKNLRDLLNLRLSARKKPENLITGMQTPNNQLPVTSHQLPATASTSLSDLLRLRSATCFDSAQQPASTPLSDLLRLRSATCFDCAQRPATTALSDLLIY